MNICKRLVFIGAGFVVLLATAAGQIPVHATHLPAVRAALPQDSETETVLSTFRPRPGKEDDLLKTMNENWSTLRKLGLVLAEPHLILRGKDDSGKTIFVEILTWRDHDAADHVPPELQTIWNRMQTLVETRGGHPGIEFPEFEIVSSTP